MKTPPLKLGRSEVSLPLCKAVASISKFASSLLAEMFAEIVSFVIFAYFAVCLSFLWAPPSPGQSSLVPNLEEEIDLVSDVLSKQGRGPLPHGQEGTAAPGPGGSPCLA